MRAEQSIRLRVHHGKYTTDDVHVWNLSHIQDSDLDVAEIFAHVLSSETGIVEQRYLCNEIDDKGFKVKAPWSDFYEEEHPYDPLTQVFQDVLRLVMKLLDRETIPK